MSLSAIQRNIDDQPGRIGMGQEEIDSMSQGEEAAVVFLQMCTRQVQGIYKLLIMALGIVPDYDAFVIHLPLDDTA